MEENNVPQVPVPEKKRKKVPVGRVIFWLVILLVFLFVTNPSLIPFLSQSAKDSVRGTWEKVFGDVGKVAGTFKLNLATIFQVIAIILAMIFITQLVKFILGIVHPKSPKAKSAVTLFHSAVSYITVIVGFFWCLGVLGVNLSTIFASVGIIALIIGFGAQSLVEDLVTGIFLVFENHFNVGDIIEYNGFRGTVESIGIRTTAIADMGNNVKVVNNSDLRNILNRSTAASVAVTTVSVGYGEDLEKVETVIAQMLPRIREKYPDIFLEDPIYSGVNELGESGVVLRFTAKVREKDVFSAPRKLNREIKLAFDKAGIEIPYNQIVVHQADK